MDEALARLRLPKGSRRILEALMRLPSVRRSGSGWPKQETLAAAAGVSLRTLRLALRRLAAAGLVRTVRGQYGLSYRLPWHLQFGPFRPSVEWREAPRNCRSAPQKLPISDAKIADLSESSPYSGFSSLRAKGSTRARRADAATPPPPSDRQPEPLPPEIEAETLRLALAHVDGFPAPSTARRILAAAGPAPPAEALARFKAWAEDRSFRVARRFRHFGGLVMAFAEDLPAVKARLEGSALEALPAKADGTLDSLAMEDAMQRFGEDFEAMTAPPAPEARPWPGNPFEALDWPGSGALAQIPGPALASVALPAPRPSPRPSGPSEAPERRDPGPAFDFDRAIADLARAKAMPEGGGFRPPGPAPRRSLTLEDLAPRLRPRPGAEIPGAGESRPLAALPAPRPSPRPSGPSEAGLRPSGPDPKDVMRRRLREAARHPDRGWF